MQSKARTVFGYLKELPETRKREIQAVRKVVKENLPKGLVETMQYGMICYVVPLSLYPKGYGGNKEVPLPALGLASQKNYMALYMMNLYGDPKTDKWFRVAYKKSGKKLDMGKGCVRFKTLDDLPLDVIGKAVKATPVKKFIETYDKTRK
jgi:hypothetical protein